jgi:2-polyprenyl-6-hydroxyphenyl methylase/3-demethylubiquinone-9 3-methyltransferase
MTLEHPNSDHLEKEKFSELSHHWWDIHGPLSSLHDINQVRMDWILSVMTDLSGKQVLDIGCGGGILSESLAKAGAQVTGIDISTEVLAVAKKHAEHQQLKIAYIESSAESFSQENHQFDVVTCMELLEHVPDLSSTIAACAQLLKPSGMAFFSTINRTCQAKLLVIFVAEYLLNLLPKQTHDFEKFITPAELAAACRKSALTVTHIQGFSYSPISRPKSTLSDSVSVNYMMAALRQ